MSKKMNCTPKVRQKLFGVQFKMKFSIQLIIIDQRVFVLAINLFTTLLRSSALGGSTDNRSVAAEITPRLSLSAP